MRRIISVFLALILALSLCAALAEDPGEIPGTVDLPYAGLRFVPPEGFRDVKGVVFPDEARKLDEGIWYATWYYVPATDEEFAALTGNPDAAQDIQALFLFHVFSIGKGMTFSDFNKLLRSPLPEENVREIGQAGDTSFYLYMEGPDPDYANFLEPDYAAEYSALAGAAEEFAAAFTCYEPQPEPDPNAGAVGARFDFSTTDVDGNTVTSADLFARNEITMINIWATWCPPCIGELQELQQIHTRLQDQNCGIIGMLTDNDLDTARQLIADNGVAYPVVIAPDELYELLTVEYIPTTVFVDKDGIILDAPIVGAQVGLYEPALESLLLRK